MSLNKSSFIVLYKSSIFQKKKKKIEGVVFRIVQSNIKVFLCGLREQLQLTMKTKGAANLNQMETGINEQTLELNCASGLPWAARLEIISICMCVWGGKAPEIHVLVLIHKEK